MLSSFPEVEGNLALELSLDGPWTTWGELLYDLPVTDTPLQGSSKGMIAHTRIPAAPLLDRAWRFKARFSLPSLEELHFQNLMLLSDLSSHQGKSRPLPYLGKIKGGFFAFSSPDLSRLSPFTPVPLAGTLKGKEGISTKEALRPPLKPTPSRSTPSPSTPSKAS